MISADSFWRRVCRLLVGAVLFACLAPAGAVAQQPVPAPPVTVDGPSPDLAMSTGLRMAIARDGTGGVSYIKQAGSTPHAFASALVAGALEPPVQLDPGLPAASTPVIAAGNGGLLLVAFVSAGELYVVEKPNSTAPFGTPTALVSGATSPSLSITNFGKAYLAFTVADGGGHDVRTAYYYAGRWTLEGAALNATPGDDAGSGAGRPQVAAAGDGVAVVTWGENGAIYSRRVWATSPSVVYERADGDLLGCNEVSADDPVVGTGGDSSYADVAFHEQLSCSGQKQSRVLMNRLRGSAYDGLVQVDGLASGGSDGALAPQIAMGEYGQGLVISQHTSHNDLFATALANNGAPRATTQVNQLPLAQPPDAAAAMAGLRSDLVAWQQNPGGSAAPEIRVRYAPDGAALGPEIVLSSPTAGPPDAGLGLAAAGDVNGDAAVAWLQGAGPQTELLAALLYQPPGSFPAVKALQYQRTARPTLAWSAPKEAWGPLTYSLMVDGTSVAQGTATSVQLPSPLSDGPHVWQVTATNPAGETSTMRQATVFVDTVAPTISLAARGRVRLGSRLGIRLSYGDSPPAGEPQTSASGVDEVKVNWGDGSDSTLPAGSHRASHVYRLARRYRVSVLVVDAAGNSATATRRVRVSRPAPPARHRARGRRR